MKLSQWQARAAARVDATGAMQSAIDFLSLGEDQYLLAS
jgi:hypothetical protein